MTTSCLARRPSAPMPSAPASAKTARPQMTLRPSSPAPAAPAKAPFGMACAANDWPRRTAKNPVTPAITATMLAAIQVFIIRLENMPAPPRSLGSARPARARRRPRRGSRA